MNNEEFMRRLRAWQNYPLVHPFTCRDDKCRGTHREETLQVIEVDGKVFLYCQHCKLIQCAEFTREAMNKLDIDEFVREIQVYHDFIRQL